jgi:hypothetical protein
MSIRVGFAAERRVASNTTTGTPSRSVASRASTTSHSTADRTMRSLRSRTSGAPTCNASEGFERPFAAPLARSVWMTDACLAPVGGSTESVLTQRPDESRRSRCPHAASRANAPIRTRDGTRAAWWRASTRVLRGASKARPGEGSSVTRCGNAGPRHGGRPREFDRCLDQEKCAEPKSKVAARAYHRTRSQTGSCQGPTPEALERPFAARFVPIPPS